MKKVKINFHYKYLGPDIGAVPYIYLGYIDELGNEKNALEVLYDRRSNAALPHTGYYYGEDTDGNSFKTENREDIPSNVKYPYMQKMSDYNPLADYEASDIETIVKMAIIDIAKSYKSGVEVIISQDLDSGFSTERIDDFNSESIKNAVVYGVSLDDKIECDKNIRIEDKISIISSIMVKLFEASRKRQIGFGKSNHELNDLLSFEVEGLNLDLIKDMPNYTDVIYHVALNHSKDFTQRVNREMQERDREFREQKEEQTFMR